jgi:hypothetical protein
LLLEMVFLKHSCCWCCYWAGPLWRFSNWTAAGAAAEQPGLAAAVSLSKLLLLLLHHLLLLLM